ncbi:MAG: hypothetical protein ACHBNF_02285 [Chromatiales bacterium]
MSVILDIDLDYFGLFPDPLPELRRILDWAQRPVDFIVPHHHEAFRRWKKLVAAGTIGPPHLLLHVDEHHDMMSEIPPPNLGSFLYFAMRHWPQCKVVWITVDPIDHPSQWLSDDAWDAVSSRFRRTNGFRPHWRRPDLVSVSTSPGFVDPALTESLLTTIVESRAPNQ